MKLESFVQVDGAVRDACASFDFTFDGVCTTEIPDVELPGDFKTLLITGASGSGKSTIIREVIGCCDPVDQFQWDPSKAIISQMPDDPQGRLMGVGLNSIPAWCRPYHVLSTGEKFRADLARRIGNGAVVDEFTSTVDRNVAKSCSVAVSRYIKARNFSGVVFASCHSDIIEWLSPEWVLNMEAGELYAPASLRPKVEIRVFSGERRYWDVFRRHHYLNHSINNSARIFVATWGDTLVGFSSAIAFPNGNFKKRVEGAQDSSAAGFPRARNWDSTVRFCGVNVHQPWVSLFLKNQPPEDGRIQRS